jgi:NAD(P)-dependent dehydrogenase (short-subunit alcohol dehydrogenase family)
MEKVMIIAGGSRGIGAAVALLAADRGYDVCINYLHQQEAANQVVDAIEQIGRRAIAVAADISSEPDVIHLFNQVDEQLGFITALVNNAGILAPQMRLETMTTARLSQVFATNILGSFLWLYRINYAELQSRCQQMRHLRRKFSKFLKPYPDLLISFNLLLMPSTAPLVVR